MGGIIYAVSNKAIFGTHNGRQDFLRPSSREDSHDGHDVDGYGAGSEQDHGGEDGGPAHSNHSRQGSITRGQSERVNMSNSA